MITYKKGDLFSVKEGVIAHGCNAQGIMGSGVAIQVKRLYPEAYYDYLDMPKTLGSVGYTPVTPTLSIANCITQEFYGRDPATKYVSYPAMIEVFRQLNMLHNTPIHIPKIGAGLGGGDWEVIERIIKQNAPLADITVWTL